MGNQNPAKNVWLFPSSDENGNEIQSLPPYLPRVIKSVTVQAPDLTKHFPKTVKKIFELRRKYFTQTTTLDSYLNDNPLFREPTTEEQFRKDRNRIISEPLKDFKQDPLLRLMLWNEHGTAEIANQFGYMGDVYEMSISPDGTCRRFTSQASIAMSLAFRLQDKRNLNRNTAWEIVSKLKFVMIYDGVPTQRFIYLEGMKESLCPPSNADRALNTHQTPTKTPAVPTLHCPDLDRMENLISRQEKLENNRKQNLKNDARLARKYAEQSVTREEVIYTLKVKTDRGVRKICARHQVEWPQNQGALDRLKVKHLRHKKALGEKIAKQNKARYAKQRGIADTLRHD